MLHYISSLQAYLRCLTGLPLAPLGARPCNRLFCQLLLACTLPMPLTLLRKRPIKTEFQSLYSQVIIACCVCSLQQQYSRPHSSPKPDSNTESVATNLRPGCNERACYVLFPLPFHCEQQDLSRKKMNKKIKKNLTLVRVTS